MPAVGNVLYQQAGTDDVAPMFDEPRLLLVWVVCKALQALQDILDVGCNFEDVQSGLEFSKN